MEQAQLVPITKWAEIVFGEFAPHINTLHRWIHTGRISPKPLKRANKWWVSPTAQYVED